MPVDLVSGYPLGKILGKQLFILDSLGPPSGDQYSHPFSQNLFLRENLNTVPPRFLCWNLSPIVMVLVGKAFGRWLGDEGRDLMNGIWAVVRDGTDRGEGDDRGWGG